VEGHPAKPKSDLGIGDYGTKFGDFGNPVNEPVMGTSVQVTNGTPGDAPEWGLTRFAASTAVLNSGSSDESATAKRLTGVCGSP